MHDVAAVIAGYLPVTSLDCGQAQYAARLQACSSCEHRRGVLCAIDAKPITERARLQSSRCLAGKYPIELKPIPLTPPAPMVARPPRVKSTVSANPTAVRVAFLTPGLQRGGAERWILSLCRWMAAEVVGVVSTSNQIDEGNQQELRRLDIDLVDQSADPTEARRVLQSADVILSWGIGKLAEHLAGIDTPVVWVAHGACDWTRQLVDQALGRVNHWVSVSEMALRVYPPEVQAGATVIHNGVDVDRTAPIRGRRAMRQLLGVRDDQFAVGYLGRFSPEKRPAAVAEAVACLPPQYVAVMAGSGWRDAETRAEALAAAPGRVIFAGHHAHVGDVLASFDAWVNVSPSEGMCLSLIEAWLAGVPCISTRTGAINELERDHGRLVCAVPIGADGQTLARAVLSLQSNLAAPQRARALAWSQLTSPAMAARWDDFLNTIVVRR